jgi:hypothetical protein
MGDLMCAVAVLKGGRSRDKRCPRFQAQRPNTAETEGDPDDEPTRGIDRRRAADSDRPPPYAGRHFPSSGFTQSQLDDTLHLLTHLGSADEKTDGKYSLKINGEHLVFHRPHSKHLDAREITELRHFLASAGVSPEKPHGAPPAADPASVDVVALIDHHGAKLYRINLASDQHVETVTPYDPHHFLHHLHHRDELREHGQRPPRT